jgi:hypothetical protein
MKTPSVTASTSHKTVEFTFTTRATTAVEMLDLELALQSEQETKGRWDILIESIYEVMDPLEVAFSIMPEYFRGTQDVIFELRVHITARQDCKLDVESEQISGTILTAVCNHFGWTGWDTPKLAETFESKRFKHLDAFKEK